MNELLKTLTEAVGVSGREKEVRLLIHDLIADLVDEWRVDALGNLIATKRGTGEIELRVLVDAHMDEVGLIITSIERDGTCKFRPAGGFDARALLGKVVQVGPKKLTGVIGLKPVHLLSTSQEDTVVKIDAMYIDVGAKDRSDAGKKVKVGDAATFLTDYHQSGDIAFGKAFDNRAGCAALIELLKEEPFPFDLVASFSVQEEVGLRGARVVSYDVKPDAALVIECTPAYDLPSERDVSPNVSVGKGPAIYVMDAATIQDPRLVGHLSETASDRGIPYQIRQPGGGGTNTGPVQRAGQGVPAATIAVPCRYPHGPLSVINLVDYSNLVSLTDSALRTLKPEFLNRAQ